MDVNLSSIIKQVHSQVADVNSAVHRLRAANRRLTGYDGAKDKGIASSEPRDSADRPPLLVELHFALAELYGLTADLRSELDCLEQVSETGAVAPERAMGPASGGLAAMSGGLAGMQDRKWQEGRTVNPSDLRTY